MESAARTGHAWTLVPLANSGLPSSNINEMRAKCTAPLSKPWMPAMEFRTTGLSLVLLSVCLLTVTQLIIKSRLGAHGAIPLVPGDFLCYLLAVLQDWRLMLGVGVLVFAAVCWYAGISRLPLSLAFPVAALSYPMVFAGAVLVLGEAFSWPALIGNLFIVAGVLLVASGA